MNTLKFSILLLCMGVWTNVYSQSINTDFGKNRIQHHEDFKYWNKYETTNFITYWYGKARNIGEPVTQMAGLYHDEVQKILEHRINDKIEIIVYTDVTDLKQSNIGLEEAFTSQAGRTKIVGNKMFVYFDGNHQLLKQQIREGIASVYLGAMLFGDNFQEIVQNAVLLDLPEWYKEGIVSYCGRYWDHLLDDELRDLLLTNEKYYDFEKFSEDFPRIAGHSMWFFLDQNYGKSSISNLLYLTRITRNLDNALLYVFNNDLKTLSRAWADYYRQHFDRESGQFESDSLSTRVELEKREYIPVSSVKLSHDGKYLAIAQNHLGRLKIKVVNIETGEIEKVFSQGFKNGIQSTDYNYPVMAWHPTINELTYVYEKKDILYLEKYEVGLDKRFSQLVAPGIQRVWSISYLEDEQYVISANTNGYSDLYYYNIKNRNFSSITNDFYDDLDAEVVQLDGKRGILFSSNRQNNHIFPIEYDTIIPIGQFDLFFYDLQADDKSLKRLTNTDNVNERYPYAISQEKVTYLSAENGIENRYIVSTVAPSSYYASSNKKRNIIRHHAVANMDLYVYTYYVDGRYEVFLEDVNWGSGVLPFNTRYNNRAFYDRDVKKEKGDEVFIPYASEQEEQEEMQEGYFFQSPYGDPEVIEPITNRSDLRDNNSSVFSTIVVEQEASEKKEVEKFVYARASAALLKFKVDNFTAKMDNDILFEGLESYTGNSDELLTSPMGFLLKANMKDILEDFSIVAGARFPLTFNGSEYFVTFENRKALLDKKYAIYRKSQLETIDANSFPMWKAKKVSTFGMYQLKYPFDIFRSVRGTTSLRFDQFYSQSVNEKSFGQPISSEKRLGLKLEYIYDNTFDFAYNIMHGTRYKFFVEAINEFNIDFVDNFEFDLSKGFTTIMGFDARHYVPLFRYSVLAVRASGASSFGSKKNLYYLGGVNNSLSNGFEQNVAIPGGNFAYKTNVFHLRGFSSNIRNGTSYGLVNLEARIPVFRYFMGNYGGSSFLRNLQFVLFYDVGTAWHGSSPYSDKNPLNTVRVESPPVLDITIRYFRDPLVMGYGLGMRMRLLGYYVRVDYATGIETRVRQTPKLHFSIGLDF